MSGESITRRIFIFFAAGEPLGGKGETSSFESCFGLEGEVKFVVLSWLSVREGRRLLKFTPPDIFNFCRNSIIYAVTTLELCLESLKTCNVEDYSKNFSKHPLRAEKLVSILPSPLNLLFPLGSILQIDNFSSCRTRNGPFKIPTNGQLVVRRITLAIAWAKPRNTSVLCIFKIFRQLSTGAPGPRNHWRTILLFANQLTTVTNLLHILMQKQQTNPLGLPLEGKLSMNKLLWQILVSFLTGFNVLVLFGNLFHELFAEKNI